MKDAKEGFRDVLAHFDTAMVCTHRTGSGLRARPMSIACVEDGGDVWFATSLDSGKVEEAEEDPEVLVTMQSKTRFLSLSGRAEIVLDKKKIHALWKPAWKVWFPEGRDDPTLVLMRVRATEAEYWDQAGSRGLRYAFEAARGLVKGEKPHTERGDHHGHVEL